MSHNDISYSKTTRKKEQNNIKMLRNIANVWGKYYHHHHHHHHHQHHHVITVQGILNKDI
jgi:hypothetical protein